MSIVKVDKVGIGRKAADSFIRYIVTYLLCTILSRQLF